MAWQGGDDLKQRVEEQKRLHEERRLEESRLRCEQYKGGERVLYPLIEEVCEEFATALGFRLALGFELKPDHPYIRDLFSRFLKKRQGFAQIAYYQRSVFCVISVNVRLGPPASIAVQVRAPFAIPSGRAKSFKLSALGTTLSSEEFGDPPDAARAREALGSALERAITPYVEDWRS